MIDAHPLAALIPEMTPDEYDNLQADIHEHGLLNPIILYDGLILDGRHRYRACLDLKDMGVGIEPRFERFCGTDSAAASYVISQNMHRRHLTTGQRSMIANELKEKLQETVKPGAPEGNMNASKNNSRNIAGIVCDRDNETSAIAARVCNVGVRSVDAAAKIKREAPDLAEQVHDGGMDLWQAEKELKQRRKEAAAEARRQSAATIPCDPSLLHGDFRILGNEIADGSVDLIFTDPPYDKEAIQLYDELGEFAARVLKPGGICLAYTGQAHLPAVLCALQSSLEYAWTCAIRHTGGELRFRKYAIHNGWKPIVMFYKPPLELWWDWFTDIISGSKEKDTHDWQQAESEATHYLKALCPPGGIVVDPFCGGGTTLVAAKKMGLRYIGFEIDETAYRDAQDRLAK